MTGRAVSERARTVYMIVDLDQAAPVAGPYLHLEHSRDAWHLLIAPGLNLSHLELFVRDRHDLVAQVRTWSQGYLRQRQLQREDDLRQRELRRAAHCRGCG